MIFVSEALSTIINNSFISYAGPNTSECTAKSAEKVKVKLQKKAGIFLCSYDNQMKINYNKCHWFLSYGNLLKLIKSG